MKNEEDKEGDDGIDEARIWVLQVTKQFIQRSMVHYTNKSCDKYFLKTFKM
jgi:hypothetical protein